MKEKNKKKIKKKISKADVNSKYGRRFDNISPENIEIINKYVEYRRDILQKKPTTVYNDRQQIRKLANFLGDKKLEDVTENDMQLFFKDSSNYGNLIIKDHLASAFVTFYRWLFKITEKRYGRPVRPDNMKWYEYATPTMKAQSNDPTKKDKQFITADEYTRILKFSSKNLMDCALWETLYLSGGRPDEISNLKIKDVINNNGRVKIIIRKSKTFPREVPLAKHPSHLMTWIRKHPFGYNPESPLWITLYPKSYGNRIETHTIGRKLKPIIRRANQSGEPIKESITPHCFRRTRATIMFNERSKDGGLIYDDRLIAMFFGWHPRTVIQRREEYDLRNKEDLHNLVFESTNESDDYEVVKYERDNLVKTQQKKIEDLEEQIEKMNEILDGFSVAFGRGVVPHELIYKNPNL